MSLTETIQQIYPDEVYNTLVQIGQIAHRLGLKAYAVGGFVRDLLLQTTNFDIDIMVNGDAIPFATQAAKEFNAECKLIDRFHTAHMYLPGMTVDFSSARKEIYEQPGALPTVSLSSNITDDLHRRDFTINAIALSISPDKPFELVDPFGGARDIERKQIKILHAKSFEDDPTRLYRALRFADRFNFNLEPTTEDLFDTAIAMNAPATVSPKRIAAEIDKCFQEKRPLTLLNKYQSAGLLSFFHKSFTRLKRPAFSFCMVKAVATRLSFKFKNISENALFWSLLLLSIPPAEAQPLLNASGLPHSITNTIWNTLTSFSSVPQKLIAANDNFSIYKTLSEATPETTGLMLLCFKQPEITSKLNTYVNELSKIKPAISGDDLLEIGIAPGPQIRDIFEQILRKKLNGIEMTRKDELDLARRISGI